MCPEEGISVLFGVKFCQSPAPGYRFNHTGVAGVIGHFGYGWTSTIRDPYGMFLGFSTTILNPCAADGRAYGFQLRCLSE